MPEVIYMNQGHEFWDQTLIIDSLKEVKGERQIVVIPGAINDVDEMSMELKQYDKILVIITSDEESKFPIDDLFHPDMIIYSTYYNPKFKNVDHWLPIGYPKHISFQLPVVGSNDADIYPLTDKTMDWFFSGQVTHDSRRRCVEALRGLRNGELEETDGFAKGLSHDEYYALMARAKVCPAPMGNVNDDSFRLYEALELGAVPIPEHRDFWMGLFGEEPPFPILESYDDLPGYIQDSFSNYPELNNKCQAWWLRKKREIIYQLRSDCAR